nr:STING domain-containing protein [uncultured Psychroserpens sp.]
MKKRVFIGSSTEELGTAKIVQRLLQDEFDVVIWDEKLWEKGPVFKLNNNFLTDLLASTLKFDFGILIGSPDDKVESRKKVYMQARDNVLFELGLFVGRLGLDKCAFLVSKDVKIPSDFGGIKLSLYDNTNLVEKVDEIRDLFKNSSSNDLNFFPSSTIASTYYENFVKLVCEYYINNDGFDFNDIKYKKVIFKIFVPEILTDNANTQSVRLQNKLKINDEISFGTPGRMRSVRVSSIIEEDTLILADFPTILSGIKHAISNLLPKEFNEQNDEYKLVLNRELNKFIESLEIIVRRNNYHDFVRIVRV